MQLLVSTGVHRYLELHSVDDLVHVASNGTNTAVPCSKEDVFNNESLSLLDKRLLMKTLAAILNAPSSSMTYSSYLRELRLPPHLIELILNVMCLELSNSELSCEDGLAQTRLFLESAGKFSKSPILSSVFGLGSEISQAFSRFNHC